MVGKTGLLSSASGAEVSFNFDKSWAGKVCALSGQSGCETWRASMSKTCWEMKVHGGQRGQWQGLISCYHVAFRCSVHKPGYKAPVRQASPELSRSER